MPKKCQELEGELEELKARILALTASQAEVRSQAGEDASSETAEVHAHALSGLVPLEFDELVDALKGEVDDLNPLTCLAIFGLGVLTGRLLAP